MITENEIAREIVDAAFHIHKRLGPGLLESVYETVFGHELKKRGLKCVHQQWLPVKYDEIWLDIGFRPDIIVEDLVIIEIKSVEILHPVHSKQLLTYLRLANKRLGLLVNFNSAMVKDGIKRIANNMPQ
jgi:GxxExxY protein